MHINKFLIQFFTLTLCTMIVSCTSVSLDQPKQPSAAFTDNSSTNLGNLADEWQQLNAEKSGFFPLLQGMDGLGARLELAEKAELSIDLQYFMMKDDTAGLVMADALLKAADRGVRIRFLLDDIFTTEPDSKLQLLDQHPNIEVRLFNPVSRRGLKALNFVGHFRQANRRMHNKSFTVDNAVSVIGGRNIADEYFQLNHDATFADFDMLALGPIAREISASFDMYWNHILAIPVAQLSTDNKSLEIPDSVRAEMRAEADQAYARIYQQALESEVLQELINDKEMLFVADARVLSDDPDKLDHRVGEEYMLLLAQLDEVLDAAQQEVIFITPYFVPGEAGMQEIINMRDRDVRVVLITNSLASTNHVPVHSGYEKYRKQVLNQGVELHEVRANAGRELQGGDGPEKLTLHTKLILIDRRYLFVGSLNLDLRSFEINAEMGVLIDSVDLTSSMATDFDEKIPAIAYNVILNDKGKLEWHGTIDGEEVVETKEPQTSAWRRFKAWFMKITPEQEL